MPQQASELIHAPTPSSQQSPVSTAGPQTRSSMRRRDRSRRRIRALICAGGAATAAAALGLTALVGPPAPAEAAFASGGLQRVTALGNVGAEPSPEPIAPSSTDSEGRASATSDRKPAGTGSAPAKEPVEAPSEPAAEPAGKPALDAPLAEPSVSSSYGNRVNPMVGSGQEMHTGTDFAGACGTPVLASSGGTVTESGWHPYGGGQRIVIDHGEGLKTTYNHLSSLGVTVGDEVDRGKPIGAVGSTGNSTGCHLHFEVVVDGKTVDPGLHL